MTSRLAITLGDPRGIGPEIVGKALQHAEIASLIAGGALSTRIVGPRGTTVPVNDAIGTWVAGAGSPAQAGRLAGWAIERAVQLVREGGADAIVTAPIDKAALHAGGFDYPGHTEMLGALTSSNPAMMLASERLRVVLATTHIALRDVPAAVTQEAIARAAETTRKGLQTAFGISDPRLALCALNPHGGDQGRFGDEDERILVPAARACGIAGPFPADTVFVRAMRGEFDAVIAPYHDVGMTAIKVASFGSAVNITLGLPFVRTSPDHGTAMDIAGQGIADESSMVRAILMAHSIVSQSTASLQVGRTV